jgi:two-component system, LytTR family, response regulator
MDNILASTKQALEVKTPDGLKIICFNNILYVEGAGKCSIVHFKDLSNLIAYHSLKWFNNHLSIPYFYRCHNSYIVNCGLVDYLRNNRVIFKNKNSVPLARNKRHTFKENLKYLMVILSLSRK